MFRLEVLLTEAQLAQEFQTAWEQRYLPEKFFYWFPLSVEAWLELCRGSQPYKNFARSHSLIVRHAGDIARRLKRGDVEVVSLGAGQGDKDVVLLKALGANGGRVRYRPVDSSLALLELALGAAAEVHLPALGLKADLDSPATVEALAASAERPRLYLVLGNALGVIDPLRFLGRLRGLLRREDRVVVDGEIFHAQDTMSGYDNPVNRRFAFGPLAAVGLEEGSDGALVFESESDARQEGLHRVTKHFRPARRLQVPVAGRQVLLPAGEKIAMNCSYKYSRTAFLEMLCAEGGLQPLNEYPSDDEQFLMVLAGPGAA